MARTRKNPVQIYLSDEELKLLESRTKECGFANKSEFIRKSIISGGNLFIVNTEELFEGLQRVSAEVNRFGNAVNQIAKRINATNSIYHQDMVDIQESQKEISRIIRRDMSLIDRLALIV